jgi:energy-coupling factor transporter ATP-binding protein EcfA2
MKTEISRFCENYHQMLSTLPPVLRTAAETMETGDSQPLSAPLATLNDIRARLRSLVEKVDSQQAYLLIFGPLKSGKSTLMNAISGTYVSEVTSLPGYPCLVYVRNAEEPRFSVTRYNGRESVFANGTVLKEVIADSHIALADQIRMTEEAGGEFDPRVNFSEAIRRADVALPVQSLAESGTVLVDTPGLYSRMKFGYDVLAREFRDTASCAVFVVKTDNLFLEQVFAEFNQLLGLFSRIFLVINVDSHKRDLQPDGSLRLSAESQHPEQVIEAFKTLSMAGPMREAYKDGRLRLHAVDLLSAASSFLANNSDGTGAEDAQKQQFDAFLNDLTDYLNSSDYTQEFIRDSLRQGAALCTEARGVCDGEAMAQLATVQDELAAKMREFDERITAVDRLLCVDWEATFEKVHAENTRLTMDRTSAAAAGLKVEMRSAFDRWHGSDESLQSLADGHWNPQLVGTARSLAAESRFGLLSLLSTSFGGAEPAAVVMDDLHLAGFKLAGAASEAMPALDEPGSEAAYLTGINQDAIPVKKTFADWLLFRRIQTVRRRLFGKDSAQAIPAAIKQKRLPETAREAFHQMIDNALKEKFPSLPTRHSEALLSLYVTKFRDVLLEQLRQHREGFAAERAALEAPFEANQKIIAATRELGDEAARVMVEIDAMSQAETVRPLAQDAAQIPELAPAPTAWEAPAA